MILSYLFTPADQPGKVAKALASDADAVILDLEDAVDPARRPAARDIAAGAIGGRRNVWVRINPLGSKDAELDLAAVIPAAPAGIVLPKPESADAAVELARQLDELETKAGLERGCIGILPLCTERPGALFALGAYRDATQRLAGLSWGAEDLSSALGAAANRDEDGEWLPPYQLARSLCLFAAAAAGVPAIDTVYTNFRDAAGLARAANAARRDGFSGMLAIHPAQIAVIHQAFTPSTAEIDRAQQIVERFADAPQSGTVGLDGVMLDRPHLLQAQRTLELAERARGR